MAKRFTDTQLWDEEWFMSLSCKLKCLVKFVRDKADLAGVWSPNWTLAKNYIGEKVTEEELLKIDGGNQFVKIGAKIFCIGFVEFQYGQLSEKSPVHRKVLAILDSHKIDYKYPINRVQEEYKDKEESKEEETDKDKEAKISKIVYPFESENFSRAWDGWKEYKKSQHRFTYKGDNTEQIALKDLAEKSGNNEQTAIQIIQQSIASGWKGFFELKTNQHGTGKQQQNGNHRLSAEYLADLQRRINS